MSDGLETLREKRVAVEDKISDLIEVSTALLKSDEPLSPEEIALLKERVPAFMTDLQAAVEEVGVDADYLKELLDLVLETRNSRVFTASVKNKIVAYTMIPRQPITSETCLEILSCVSLDVYHIAKDSATHSPYVEKGVPQSVQSNLLNWLNCVSFDFAKDKGFLRLLPLLFNLLAFTYARSRICILLITILSNATKIDPKFNIRTFATAYRMQILREHIEKNPNDAHLAALYLFLSDHKVDTREDVLVDYRIPSRTFDYPSPTFMATWQKVRANDIKLSLNSADDALLRDNPQFVAAASHVKLHVELISSLVRTYSTGKLHNKRRKLEADDSMENSTLDFLTHSTVIAETPLPSNTEECATRLAVDLQVGKGLLYGLLVDYNDINTKTSELLAKLGPLDEYIPDSSKVRNLPFYVLLLKVNDPDMSEMLDQWLNAALLEADGKLNDPKSAECEVLLGLAHFLQLADPDLPSLWKLMFDSGEVECGLLPQLFSHLNVTKHSFNRGVFSIEGLEFAPSARYVATIDALTDLFENSYDLQWAHLKTYNEVVLTVIVASTKRFSSNTSKSTALYEKLVLSRFLKHMAKMPLRKINPANLVLPPELAYSMFFEANPLLTDAMCRQVMLTKSYYIETNNQVLSDDDITYTMPPELLRALKEEIHFSYVMDYCNLLWRNKALHRAGQNSKGFLMAPDFVDTLVKRQFYMVEDDGRTESNARAEFNIFHSPAFANLFTTIIRHIEDETEECGVRLAGPYSTEKFNRLCAEQGWLESVYADSKQFELDILARMAKTGYTGVHALLLSSLKSLKGR